MFFLVPRLVAGPHFLVPRFVPGLPFLMPRFVSGLHFLVPTFTRNFYNKLFVWVNMKVSKIFHMVLVVNRHILKIFLLNLRRKSANNFDKICARFLYMIMQEQYNRIWQLAIWIFHCYLKEQKLFFAKIQSVTFLNKFTK